MEYILQTKSLSKKYGNKVVLDEININVPRGSIYGLIGKNGAGKTTLMRIVSGLAHQTTGSYQFFFDSSKKRDVKTIGALIENPGLYEDMTAIQNIEYFKSLFGVSKENNTKDLLKVVGLKNYDKKKVKDFSLGMKQRLGIAISLLGKPELLILDEPINGLDAQGVLEIRKLIQHLNEKEGMTVIISSHILSELSKLATHYGIVNSGKIIDEFSRETLINECCKCIKVVIEPQCVDEATKIFKNIFKSKNFDNVDSNTFRIFEEVNPSELNSMLVANGIKVCGLGHEDEDIESYFINKISGGL